MEMLHYHNKGSEKILALVSDLGTISKNALGF
jgi:hypothetical protein